MKNRYPLLLLLFMALAGGAFAQTAQNVWVKKNPFGGAKRSRAIGFAIATRGYVCCGEDTLDIVHNDLWEYDPGTDSWMQKANLPGVGRRDAAAFVIGNKGYVGTGMSAAEASLGTTLNDFYEYDPTNNTWTTKANYPGSFTGIYFATGFAINSKGYFCCGKFGSSYYSDELWEYNPATNGWTQKANFPDGVRYGAAAFVLNGKAYFGTGTDENIMRNDFYEYNPANNTWTQKAAFPGSGRWSCNTFTIGNKGYFACGSDGGFKDEIWEYDPPTDSWTVRNPFDGGGRRSAVSFTINGVSYLGCGKGVTGKRRDFWQYYPYVTGEEQLVHDKTVMQVAPNPIDDQANVTINPEIAKEHQQLTFTLYDLQGKTIYTTNVTASFLLQREGWAAGTYAYTLSGSGKSLATGRLILK